MNNIAKFEENFNTTIDMIQYDGHIVDELKDNIESLKRTLVRIHAVAPLYSYNNQEYNGLYSFIKICVAFQNIIISNISHNNYDKINSDLLIISRLFCVMSSMLQMLVKTHLKDLEPKVSIFTESTDQLFDILDLCSTKFKPALSYIYGNYCAFWLCSSMRKSMSAFTTIMAFHASSSAKSSIKSICKSNYRGKIISNLAHSTNICFIKSFWSITEYSFINEAVPSLFNRSVPPKIAKDFFIKKPQNIYTILENSNFITKTIDQSVNGAKKEIKCRLLFEKDENIKNSDTIIIHCHGGGFVSQSPKSHEIYLKDWSKKLVNIPIISIYYILSPEGRYPQALQQILDVYLWFIDESHEEKIIELIGFNPKQIILCGDSAGGNLAAATCLALNDIRILYNENIRMPKSLMLIYTPLMLKLFSSPSRMLTTFDCLLPLGILLSCLEAYLNLGEVEEILNEGQEVSNCSRSSNSNNQADLSDKSNDDIDDGLFKCAQLNFLVEKGKFKKESSNEEFVFVNKDEVEATNEETTFKFPNNLKFKFQRGYFNALDRIKKSFYGTISSKHLFPSNPFSFNGNKKPWYIDNEEKLRKKIEILDSKCSLPYVSPLLYSKFSTLSDVSLYLVTSEFDVCLDDSIMMAKKWSGPVSLDVCENLPHGFLNFLVLSEEAKQASNLCITRLKQALYQR